MSDSEKKCPYCVEKIKTEAIKCKYCGEWLTEDKDNLSSRSDFESFPSSEKKKLKILHALKTSFGIITFIIFAFIGFVLGSWLGLIIGIFLWLVAVGSIGLSRDIADAGEVARQSKKKE